VLKLATTVVGIALADCINPSLIGGELFVASGRDPKRRTAAFTFAAWTVTFLVGLALALGLGDLILSFLPKPGAKVKYSLITAAGAVLLVGGAVVWLRRRTLASSSNPSQLSGTSHGSAALMGASVAGVELLTAFPYFAAIALIVGSSVSGPAKLSLLALYCIVYALPLIAIAAVCAVTGDRAERILQPAGQWLSAHWPVVVAPLTATIGIVVLAFGIAQLHST
jgi:cytochrome c biogenesis protein CcdA